MLVLVLVLAALGARVLADLDVAGPELRPVHRLHRALRLGRLREPHRAVALGAALLLGLIGGDSVGWLVVGCLGWVVSR